MAVVIYLGLRSLRVVPVSRLVHSEKIARNSLAVIFPLQITRSAMPPKKRKSPVNVTEVAGETAAVKKTRKKGLNLESKVEASEGEDVDHVSTEPGQEIENENHPTVEPIEKETGKRNARRGGKKIEERTKSPVNVVEVGGETANVKKTKKKGLNVESKVEASEGEDVDHVSAEPSQEIEKENHPAVEVVEPIEKETGKRNARRGGKKVEEKTRLREEVNKANVDVNAIDDPVVDNEELEPEEPIESDKKKRNVKKGGKKPEGKKKFEDAEDVAVDTVQGKGNGNHATNPEEEEPNEIVSVRSNPKRGVKKAVEKVEVDQKPVDGGDEPASEKHEGSGRGKKRVNNKKPEPEKLEDSGDKSEPSEKKSKSIDDYDCSIENKNNEKWNLKISSWNIAGMRAWVKKNGIEYVTKEDPDIMCFQETKCPESKVPAEAKLEGYHTYWASGTKDGYAGVAIYTKEKPINVTYGLGNPEHDAEGRLITAEYDKFYLLTVYVPNSGQGLKTLPKRMEWDTLFRQHIKNLDEKKPVVLCGDLNVAHQEIDLANPKTNTKHAGFTPEERENMSVLLKEGFVDSYRQLYPGKTGAYTFWTYLGNARARNTGWRLDYFVVSERMMESICDVAIRNKVLGSDHCPLTLFLHI